MATGSISDRPSSLRDLHYTVNRAASAKVNMSVARMQRQQLEGHGGFAQIADVLSGGSSSKGGAVKAASALLSGSRGSVDTVSYGNEDLSIRRIEGILRKINEETDLSLKDPTQLYEAQQDQVVKSDTIEREHILVQQQLDCAREKLKSLENQKRGFP